MPLSRRLQTPITPDNRIKFLNNEKLIRNPKGMKTPPPPFWGEEESECDRSEGEMFYDEDNDRFKNSR